MKSNRKIASAVIASFVLGSGTLQIPHAQATPAYGVAMIDVRHADGYTKDFLPDRVIRVQYYGGYGHRCPRWCTNRYRRGGSKIK
jgi:hypothetical protein